MLKKQIRLMSGICVFLLLYVNALPSFAATKIQRAGLEYQIDKTPNWVENISDTSKAPKTPADSGPTQILLSDIQVNLLTEKPIYFSHIKSVARERSGLEAVSTIKLTYNPRFEVLTLHKLSIFREGRRINKLKSARIDLAQRESRLEEGVYDENVQAIVAVDDVRVDDVVEIAYSFTGANPVFSGKYSQFFALNREIPIAKLSVRIKYPAHRKINHKVIRSALSVTDSTNGTVNVLSISADNVLAVRMEPNVPSWFPVYPMLQVTEYESWEQLQHWASALYKTPTDLSPELEQVLDKIKSEAKNQKEMAARTVTWVQNNIRYYSVAVGTSSHRPNHPIVTFSQRFGDCKDKSLLLSAMLKYLGVKAEPALVSSQVRKGIAEWLPTPLAFDHVIVKANIEQTTYWLDSTLTYQGNGLDTLGFTPFSKALLTETHSNSLTDVIAPTQAMSELQVTENITVSSFGSPITMVVEFKYYGSFAEWYRRSVASIGLRQYVEAMQADYGKDYPNITLSGGATLTDDLAANVVILTQSFQIPNFFTYENGRVKHLFYASSITPVLSFPRIPERQFPLALPYPATYSHRIVLNLPNKLDSVPIPPPDNWQDRHVNLSNATKLEPSRITFDYGLRTLEDSVSAPDFPNFSKQIKQVSNMLFSSVSLPLPEKTRLSSRLTNEFEVAKINFRNPDGAEELRQDFLSNYVIADEAILSKLISGTVLAKAYRDRAEALSSLGRREDALIDSDKSLELDANEETYVLKAEIQIYAGRYQDALNTLNHAPQSASKPNTLVDRGIANYYLGNYIEAENAFVKAAEVENLNGLPYTLIWLAIASKKAGHDPNASIEKFRSRLANIWPAEGISLLIGETSPDKLIAAAKQDKKESRMRLCEAYFFLGQKALADGNFADAKHWFAKSVGTEVVMYREYILAQHELKLLNR